MKRLIIAAALSAVIFECFAQPSAAVIDFRQYIAQNKPLMEQGALKPSEYYKNVYSKALAAGAPGFALAGLNDMIENSLQYESGAITKERFDYLRRANQAGVVTQMQQEDARIRAAKAQEDAANQAATAALLTAGAQMLEAGAPRTLAPAPISPSGFAMQWPLSSQSTSGTLRYCRYSNGAIVTLNVSNICPVMGP